jgi:AAA15 family ATPase/GTPase
MRISNLSIKNFKRFTDLTIEQIPGNAKLVLLIGSNGSGKSCVFDAFDFIIKGQKKPLEETKKKEYYLKNADSNPFIKIDFGKEGYIRSEGLDIPIFGAPLNKMPNFIGRSSIRIVPQITIGANPNAISNDADSPESYIQQDTRFLNDVYAYIQSINQALREPIFSDKAADTLQIFRDFIEPLNSSLLNILGGDEQTTIQIAEFQDATPNETAKLIFKKGQSKINYDLLSHGEKQIVILLLNFIVRQSQYEDAIIFIDEMDCHLNTSLQSRLLKEIVERWVPDSAQLWTATHALGFIEYAQEAENACVLDFDLYDFDQPQVITPSDKTKWFTEQISAALNI